METGNVFAAEPFYAVEVFTVTGDGNIRPGG